MNWGLIVVVASAAVVIVIVAGQTWVTWRTVRRGRRS